MRSPIKKHLLLTCLALPLSCMAGAMGKLSTSPKPWFIPFQGGFFGATVGKAQNIAIKEMDGSLYTLNNNTQTNGLAGIGLYLNGYSNERLHLSYGLDVFYLAQTSVRGAIVQEHFATNFTYKYDVQNVPLYAAAKAVLNMGNPAYALTADVGIGPNFMWLTGYRENSLITGLVPDRAYRSSNPTQFSVTAGAGVRLNNLFSAATNGTVLPIECGYRFFYLGQGDFRRNNDLYLTSLKTGDIYANALVCSVTV